MCKSQIACGGAAAAGHAEGPTAAPRAGPGRSENGFRPATAQSGAGEQAAAPQRSTRASARILGPSGTTRLASSARFLVGRTPIIRATQPPDQRVPPKQRTLKQGRRLPSRDRAMPGGPIRGPKSSLAAANQSHGQILSAAPRPASSRLAPAVRRPVANIRTATLPRIPGAGFQCGHLGKDRFVVTLPATPAEEPSCHPADEKPAPGPLPSPIAQTAARNHRRSGFPA